MLFGIMFAFWRFLEIITLVNPTSPPSLTSQPPLTPSLTDPHTRHACLLRAHLCLQQRPNTNLHSHPLHRLRPRRRLDHLHPVHLPPLCCQCPVRLFRRPTFRWRPNRSRLRTPGHNTPELHLCDQRKFVPDKLRGFGQRDGEWTALFSQ